MLNLGYLLHRVRNFLGRDRVVALSLAAEQLHKPAIKLLIGCLDLCAKAPAFECHLVFSGSLSALVAHLPALKKKSRLHLVYILTEPLNHDFSEGRIKFACRISSLEARAPFANQVVVDLPEITQSAYLEMDERLVREKLDTCYWVSKKTSGWRCSNSPRHYFSYAIESMSLRAWLDLLRKIVAPGTSSIIGERPRRFHTRPDVIVKFESQVSDAELKTFYRQLWPGKAQYVDDRFLNHLFSLNPYSKGRKIHFGVREQSHIVAIGSALHFPYLLAGKRAIGAMMSGWWRMPELAKAANSGPLQIFNGVRRSGDFLSVYNPSPTISPFFETFCTRAKVFRLQSFSPRQIPGGERLIPLQADFRKIAEISHEMSMPLKVTLSREVEFLEWYLNTYPYCRFQTKAAKTQNKSSIYSIHTVIDHQLSVVDFGATRLDSEQDLHSLLCLFGQAAREAKCTSIEFETSNPKLVTLSQKVGFWTIKTFYNYYQLPGGKRGEFDPSEIHETRMGGDVLPRPLHLPS